MEKSCATALLLPDEWGTGYLLGRLPRREGAGEQRGLSCFLGPHKSEHLASVCLPSLSWTQLVCQGDQLSCWVENGRAARLNVLAGVQEGQQWLIWRRVLEMERNRGTLR